MKSTDLPDLRRVAKAGAISYTKHALEQMMNRGVSTRDVEKILSSNTNQLIEVQPPSNTVGKRHKDERDLVYDPLHKPDAIVIFTLGFSPTVEINVITVERPDDSVWNKDISKTPALIRK